MIGAAVAVGHKTGLHDLIRPAIHARRSLVSWVQTQYLDSPGLGPDSAYGDRSVASNWRTSGAENSPLAERDDDRVVLVSFGSAARPGLGMIVSGCTTARFSSQDEVFRVLSSPEEELRQVEGASLPQMQRDAPQVCRPLQEVQRSAALIQPLQRVAAREMERAKVPNSTPAPVLFFRSINPSGEFPAQDRSHRNAEGR